MELRHTSGERFPQLSYYMSGKGPALVLIHGFPQTAELWKETWHKLSASNTVIAPNLPGAGGSEYSGPGLSMEAMAESVKCILDKEGINTAIIAGHSMGGYTALAFAALYPDVMMGLCMVHSMATADDEEKKASRRKAIALIEKGGKEAFLRQMMPTLFSEEYKKDNPEIIELLVKQALNLPATSLISFYNAMINRPDRTKVLSGADLPIQWVIGREDTIASPQKVLQQTRLSNVNFVSVYENCAHMAMLEQPDELVKDLAYFSKYCNKRKNTK